MATYSISIIINTYKLIIEVKYLIERIHVPTQCTWEYLYTSCIIFNNNVLSMFQCNNLVECLQSSEKNSVGSRHLWVDRFRVCCFVWRVYDCCVCCYGAVVCCCFCFCLFRFVYGSSDKCNQVIFDESNDVGTCSSIHSYDMIVVSYTYKQWSH